MSDRRTGVRRRLDTLALRIQARLDADWADHSLPWLLAVALFVLLFAMSLAVVRQLDGGPGLALWTQAAWHVRHGQPPSSTLAGLDPVTDQWSFIAWPVLWLTRWVPTSQLLAGVQAAALSLTVVPLWKLARTVFDLRIGTTVAVIAAYALAPTVHATNLSLFHPEVCAVPALAGVALFRRQGRWVPYWACVAVILVSRADLGITIAAVGILALLDGDRLAGLASMVIGLGWSIAAIVVLDPKVPEGPITAAQAFAASGIVPLAEVRNVVSDPGQLLGDLFGQASLPILVALFAPLLFLPFSAPRNLIAAVPPLALGIAAGRAVQQAAEVGVAERSFGAGRALVATVPITVAALFAIGRIGRRGLTRVNVDHRIVGAIVVASVLLFAQYAPSSPYQQPWAWGSRDQADAARLAAIAMVPDEAPITVSPQLGPQVAERSVVREAWVGPPTDDEPLLPSTRYLVLDTTAEGSDDVPLWDDDDRRAVIAALTAEGYRVTYDAAGIYGFVRS